MTDKQMTRGKRKHKKAGGSKPVAVFIDCVDCGYAFYSAHHSVVTCAQCTIKRANRR